MEVKNIYIGTISIIVFFFTTLQFLRINSDKYLPLNHLKDTEKLFYVEDIYGNTITNSINRFLDVDIKEKSVLIFEFNGHHHECIPGFAKYFYDLGYSIDVLVKREDRDPSYLSYPDYKTRVFLFKDIPQLEHIINKLKEQFKKYDYVLINSTDVGKKNLFIKLDVLYSQRGIFVAHDVSWAERVNSNLYNENRAITLGNLYKGTRVNPHYFGEVVLKDKNPRTKFFLTSTVDRDYSRLVNATMTLKKEGLDFEIIVVGRSDTFTDENIPPELKDIYNVELRVTYEKLYEKVQECDFIIITLDPDNEDSQIFKYYRATGSAQLSYGFLKPSLIHREYASIYGMTNKDSFLFDNYNFVDIMRKAIKMTNEEYKEKQNNLKYLSDNIYKESLENLKAVMQI